MPELNNSSTTPPLNPGATWVAVATISPARPSPDFPSTKATRSGGMATYAFSGSHAAISVGSSSVMITHVPHRKTDVRHFILSMPSPVPKTYFVMAENGLAGSTLEHFMRQLVYARDTFGELTAHNQYALLQKAVDETPAGSGGVLFLPWMGGSLAPSADAQMRSGFLNLSAGTTRSHLARAVLEGVARDNRQIDGAQDPADVDHDGGSFGSGHDSTEF